MATSNTTAAAASDDIAVLALFERLALAAGRVVLDVFHSDIDGEPQGRFLAGHRGGPASREDHPGRSARRTALGPCVAEEECSEGIVPVELGEIFLLIDPLDGTKEFVNRHADFTVNIA